MNSSSTHNRPNSLDYASSQTPRAATSGGRPRNVVWAVLTVVFIGGGYLWYDAHRVTACGSPANRIVSYNTLNHFVFSLDEFHKAYGHYPQGNNPGVVAALQGKDLAGKVTRADYFYVQDPPGRRPVLDRWGRICDDWGYPLVVRGGGTTRPTVYSVGANGVDEQGGGDDVLPDPALTTQPTTTPTSPPPATALNG